jgi:hypothetical protein
LHLHTLHLRKYPRGNLKSNQGFMYFLVSALGVGLPPHVSEILSLPY